MGSTDPLDPEAPDPVYFTLIGYDLDVLSGDEMGQSVTEGAAYALSFAQLKTKQRGIRDGFPAPVGLRVHRALSWYGRAEQDPIDPDLRFIVLWVSFNAAYAADIGSEPESERSAFATFFGKMARLDEDGRIYNAVWSRFSQEIRLLLKNPYIFAPFWRHHNGDVTCADWERRLELSQQATGRLLRERDTIKILSTLFDRLYVLRNQLVHGGSTWNSSVNRDQVRDGAAILAWIVPIFIDIMMENPGEDWGAPFYPVVS